MGKLSMNLFRKTIPYFTIFQDENRQQIVLMLCEHKQLTVNQITDEMNLSRPAISHHLKLMLDADVLGVEKHGTERYYFLKLDNIISLLKELTSSLEESAKNIPS